MPPDEGVDLSATDDAPVRLRPRLRRRLTSAVVMSGLWVVAAMTAVHDEPWGVLVMSVGLLPSVVIRWTMLVGLVRKPWLVEIGADGVVLASRRRVRWSDLERVEVHLTRGWRRLIPHGWDQVLLVTPVQASFADRARTRPSGYPVLLHQVRATPDEVVAAVRRFSEVGIHGWPGGR